MENNLNHNEQVEVDIRDEKLLFTNKQPKKVSLAGAVFFALLLAVGVFIGAYVTVTSQVNAKLREMDQVYAKYAKMETLLNYIDENYIREYDNALLWETV